MSTSHRPLRPIRLLRLAFGWLLAVGFAFGVYRVYRWAEPSPASLANVLSPTTASSINLELEEADFENFANGRKNWSLWAKRISFEKPAGGMNNTLNAAYIDDIRNGKLYSSPLGERKEEKGESGTASSAFSLHPASLSGSSNTRTPNAQASTHREEQHSTPNAQPPIPDIQTQSTADANAGIPAATFSAQHGRYLVGSAEGLPSEMQFTYAAQWQFLLTGDVKIRTREGYQLRAPSILVLELYNRRTGHAERHMLCSQGATIVAQGATVQANQARYDDKNQAVECMGGVRAQMQQDSAQAEYFHWSLKDNVLRSPNSVSGIWQDCPYIAQDMTIDAARHIYKGKKFAMQLRGKAASQLALGSLSLVMTTGAIPQGKTPSPANAKSKPVVSKNGGVPDTEEPAHLAAEDVEAVSSTGVVTGHHFTYTNSNRVITGDNARWVKDKGILDADGHLVMDDPEHHALCEKAHVEEKQSHAIMTGSVVLTLKPQSSGNAENANDISESKKQGAIVNCDHVDTYYKKKFTVLKGNLVFTQHILRKGKPPLDRTGTAEHAEYDGKNEVLVLFPPVKAHDSDDNEFISNEEKVIIVTKSGSEKLSGKKLSVKTIVKEDENADAENSPLTSNPADKKSDAGAKPGDTKPGDPIPAKPTPNDTKKDEPKKDEPKKDPPKI